MRMRNWGLHFAISVAAILGTVIMAMTMAFVTESAWDRGTAAFVVALALDVALSAKYVRAVRRLSEWQMSQIG